MKKTFYHQASVFFIFLVGVFFLQFFGAMVTKNNLNCWYSHLIKPSFNPPSWVFGPVWTFLYIVIAYVGGLLWSLPTSKLRSNLLVLWFAQMILNFLWSFIFFGAHLMLLAAIELTGLIAIVAILTFQLSKISKTACLGFSLYLLWIIYAGVLNWTLWLLN